ncbi:MAG: cation-transporting P-type ATPase, partial [Oscillospiraceae bacterium]|nr:cation-transporting P-type ATPase [Oscillospiraceae bacterium]
MIWHIEKIESIISYFGSNEKLGLSSSNVQIMRKKFGENKITPAPQKFKIVPFLMDILSIRVILLFSAFVISFIYAIARPDYSPFESLILLTVFLIYLCFKISVFFKKQKDISNSLKTSDTATVIRDGKEVTISASDIVMGDILLLKAGDKICADARIINAQSLVCDEQILFGKSTLVTKNKTATVSQRADFKKQINMLFSGTYIVKGDATAIVVATGDNTVVATNKFSKNSNKTFKTPLQRRLLLIAHSFQIIGLIAFAIVFLIGIIINHEQNNNLVLIMLFAFAILPVSFEWLYNLEVTHFTKLLAKIGIVVKNPMAFENLAKTKILAIPKNRVLTENDISITEIWCGEEYTVPLTAALSNEAFAVVKLAALCSNENRQRKTDDEPLGTSPTDSAIISALLKNGTKKTDLDEEFTRLAHIPFDSERRMMSTINKLGKIPVVITKGAFDAVTLKCAEGVSQNAVKCYEDMCSRSLNVIAVAYKRLSSLPAEISETAIEKQLTLLGLIGFSEDIKEDACDCLSDLRDAEINTVLFSDSDLCVCNNLATKLGIADETTLSASDDEIINFDFSSDILNYRVFPHISKESKLILLKLWKRAGATAFIATNKIPDYSIAKAYDVSCAMGEDCADILSNSADIVVRDYDLTSIVSAIVTGRKSTLNIKKAISFVCTCNLNILLNFIIFTFSG